MLKKLLLVTLFGFFIGNAHAADTCSPALNFEKIPLGGKVPVNLCREYQGKVLLMVNTASFCGFTKQYKSLESLYQRYRDQGFYVLGFPSNDFGQQEPGDDKAIKDFCDATYKVKFPMFKKTKVAQHHADPLYQELARQRNGSYPQWNFHKYLIDREGKVIADFESSMTPDDPRLLGALEKAISQKL
ncbi:MAG: glutathione peroxidase [Gammaproteobacteria bacterium]